jgi:Arc/MetJ family transcription regulator
VYILSVVSKRLVDIDDDALERARTALGTVTIKETVHRALTEAVALDRRRRMMERLSRDGLPDLRDPTVMAGAWR